MDIDTCVDIIVKDIKNKPEKWRDSKNLRRLTQQIKFIETYEDEDEEGPPPMDSEETTYYKNKIKSEFEYKNYEKVVNLASTFLESSPNSAYIIKLRSKSYWFLKDYKNAYYDMCKSQSIDYNDEDCELHSKMKEKYESEKSHCLNNTATCEETEPTNVESDPVKHKNKHNTNEHNTNNLNIDPSMINNIIHQNPELVKMAQNMMNNPEIMNNLLAGMRQ